MEPKTFSQVVYNVIERAPLGLTVGELSIAIQVPQYVCEKVVAILNRNDMVIDTKTTRKTQKGIEEIVYKAIPKTNKESEDK